jgi:hypothetical protein
MATSITTCGPPGVTITDSGEIGWSYKTKAAATTASTSQNMDDAARENALMEAKIQCSCDNPQCRERFADLTAFTPTSSVELGLLGWLFNLLGGRGWRAVVSFTFTANVWCESPPEF